MIAPHRRRRRLPACDDPGRRVPDVPLLPGALPRFARPLGLDFIVTPGDRVVLVELQHGFGRRGLIALHPETARRYRQTYWRLRRELGRCAALSDGMQWVCADKINTYKWFGDLQPPSFVLSRWGAEAEAWVRGLPAELVLLKPPRGSCGRGILVFDRAGLLAAGPGLSLTGPVLLQGYVHSRLLGGPGGTLHVGCIRHIMLVTSDGAALTFHHTTPYWRVSATPVANRNDKDALTANISRGAFPLPVAPDDVTRVRALADRIAAETVARILGLPPLPVAASVTV